MVKQINTYKRLVDQLTCAKVNETNFRGVKHNRKRISSSMYKRKLHLVT